MNLYGGPGLNSHNDSHAKRKFPKGNLLMMATVYLWVPAQCFYY